MPPKPYIEVFCPMCGESVTVPLRGVTVWRSTDSQTLKVDIEPSLPFHKCANPPQDSPS